MGIEGLIVVARAGTGHVLSGGVSGTKQVAAGEDRHQSRKGLYWCRWRLEPFAVSTFMKHLADKVDLTYLWRPCIMCVCGHLLYRLAFLGGSFLGEKTGRIVLRQTDFAHNFPFTPVDCTRTSIVEN